VYLRLFAQATIGDSPRIAAALAAALGNLGTVAVSEHGRSWKDPALVEFTVDLEPAGPVDDCVSWLLARSGPTWQGDRADRDLVWTRAPGSSLLHPAVEWAWLQATSAPAKPRYHDRDIVRVADNDATTARGIVGCEGAIEGSAPGADGR
jgi:hypothetical protein